jgi:integrase
VRIKMERTNYPGIYKRGSRYVVVWRYRGRQHKESFRTLADAREAQGKRRQSGEKRPHTRQTFEQYATAWLNSYRGRTARGLSENTRAAYRRSIERYAIPFLGHYRLSDIDPPDVREFVRHLESKRLKSGSVRKNLAPVKALFATAYEDGAIRSNPTQGLRVSTPEAEQDRQAKAMTREELGLVLAAVSDDWRPFFTFLAQTGVRISEAIGLLWSDMDLGTAPCVRIERQNYRGEVKRLKSAHSRRTIPLSAGMATALRERRAKTYRGDAFPVWTTPDRRTKSGALIPGKTLGARNARRDALDPVTKALGLEWVGFHTFRHTCASLLFAGGKDVKQVQEWLGHADPGFTLRTYVHLMDEGLGSADFLDVAFANGARAPGIGRQKAGRSQ